MSRRDPDAPSIAFDYVDPGSYAALLILGEMADTHAASPTLHWRPLELRTPGSARLDPRETDWAAMTDRVLSVLGCFGVRARTPDRIPLTRKAHELACHSREHDCFDRVHRALFEAHFESGDDIGRVDVLVRIATDAGLEPAEVRTVLGVDRFGAAVEAERRRLLDEGIEGVPTVWSRQARIEGFRGVEAFRAGLEDVFDHPDSEARAEEA